MLQETYGEDPYLSGRIAASFVEGLRGDHPRYYRANAVCKHFDAYGGPEDLPESRLTFNAQVVIAPCRYTGVTLTRIFCFVLFFLYFCH